MAVERRRQRDLDQAPESRFHDERRPRHDGEAEAGGHHALDRFGASGLHHDLQRVGRDAVLLEVVVDDLARTRARHSRLMYACSMSEAGVADFCLASGCEGTHATCSSSSQQTSVTSVGKVRVTLDEAEVETALRDAVLHRLGVGDEQPRHHGGIARLELAQHLAAAGNRRSSCLRR